MFQNYAVAIRLTLENQVTNGLLGISRQFAHLHPQALALQTQLQKIGSTAIFGGAMIGAGVGMMRMLDGVQNAAMRLNNELSLLNTLTLSEGDKKRIIAISYRSDPEVQTGAVSDRMKLLADMVPILGGGRGIEESERLLPILLKTQTILSASHGNVPAHIATNLLRVAESTANDWNPLSAEMIEHEVSLAAKALIVQHGMLDERQMLMAAKQSGNAYRTFTDRFRYAVMPTLINESGGQGGTVGTGLSYLVQSLAGGGRNVFQRANLPVWTEVLGLKAEDFVKLPGSHTLSLRPGHLPHMAMLLQDPDLWVNTILKPGVRAYAAAHGIDPKLGDTYVLGQLFRGQMLASRSAAMIMASEQLINRDVGMFNGNAGIDNYQKFVSENFGAMSMQFADQSRRFMEIVGTPILDVMGKFISMMLPNMVALGDWAQKNEPTVRAITWAFIGLAGALTFTGTVMLLTSAFRAMAIVLGLIRLPGAALAMGPALRMIVTGVGALANPIKMLSVAFAALFSWTGLIVVAVVGVGAALLAAYNHFAPFRAAILTIGDVIGAMLKAIGNAIMGVLKFLHLDGILTAGGNALKWLFTADPRAAAEGERLRREWDAKLGIGAGAANDNRRPVVPPAAAQPPAQLHATVHVGGRRVGTAVSEIQARQMGQPAATGSATQPGAFPNQRYLNH